MPNSINTTGSTTATYTTSSFTISHQIVGDGVATYREPAHGFAPRTVIAPMSVPAPDQYLSARPKKAVPAYTPGPEAESLPLSSELLVFYKRNRAPGNYEETHRHQGELRYQNFQDLLARFFITVHYNSGVIPNWREWCIGISSIIFPDRKAFAFANKTGSRTPESMHMPMLDYDGKNIKSILRKDVQLLQERWNLGPATIFQTKKGFHVYFMTDAVSWDSYRDMLESVKCCKGFRRCAEKSGYAVLRVSAKYTAFDIKLDSVLPPEKTKTLPARKLRKAHIIEAILGAGQHCGTHIASLCPEWAHYREDESPWKPPSKSGKATTNKETPTEYLTPLPKLLTAPVIQPRPDAGRGKGKLILKPRKTGQIVVEPKTGHDAFARAIDHPYRSHTFREEYTADRPKFSVPANKHKGLTRAPESPEYRSEWDSLVAKAALPTSSKDATRRPALSVRKCVLDEAASTKKSASELDKKVKEGYYAQIYSPKKNS